MKRGSTRIRQGSLKAFVDIKCTYRFFPVYSAHRNNKMQVELMLSYTCKTKFRFRRNIKFMFYEVQFPSMTIYFANDKDDGFLIENIVIYGAGWFSENSPS